MKKLLPILLAGFATTVLADIDRTKKPEADPAPAASFPDYRTVTLSNGLKVFVTIHPSALLRVQDEKDRRSGYAAFVNDLRSVQRLAQLSAGQAQPIHAVG